jgi:hypothetical protein
MRSIEDNQGGIHSSAWSSCPRGSAAEAPHQAMTSTLPDGLGDVVQISKRMVRDVHAVMLARRELRPRDGWAIPSTVAREMRRSLEAVANTLEMGVNAGLFERRVIPYSRSGAGGRTTRIYRAVIPPPPASNEDLLAQDDPD